MPGNNHRPVWTFVSDHHSVLIGDIEAFMVVGVARGSFCPHIFLPAKGVIMAMAKHGLGVP